MTTSARSSLSLRQAKAADAEQIALIDRSVRQAAMPWLPVLHTPADDLWFFTNRVLSDQRVTVACEAGGIIGFAAYEDGWLNHLYVAPDYWRRGAGAMLLEDAQMRNPTLQLWTFARNLNAQAFYTRAGFRAVERTDGRGNEEKTPDVRMVWTSSA